MVTFEIAGYELVADRLYDARTHMWVELQPRCLNQPHPPCRGRVGLDPLGRETSGDVVALSLEPWGTELRRGEPFGDLEAAKFVGPLISPVTGTMSAVNANVLADPGVLNADRLGLWLVEIALEPSASAELDELLTGESALGPWFEAEVQRFRTQGAIAE